MQSSMLSAIKAYESAGVKSILLPYGATGPDYFVMLPYFLENTSSIKFMMALRPYALTPEYAVKSYQTVAQNLKYKYQDRLWLNVVAGMLVPEEEKYVFDNYTHDISEIIDMKKRLELSEKWIKKFKLILPEEIDVTYLTIANSSYTMEFANKYFDYCIYGYHNLDYHFNKATNSKPMIYIDPLIKPHPGWSPSYIYRPTNLEETRDEKVVRNQFHEYSGSYEEVKQGLLETAKKYKINDFMILTDQKDISQLLKLVKELSSDEYIF